MLELSTTCLPSKSRDKASTSAPTCFLGILYYELLTGERPFRGESPAAVVSSILKETPKLVTELSPALPHDIARIVRRCLVKDRTRRFQSAVEVVNETRELQEEVASGQHPSGASSEPTKSRVTPRVVAAALVAGLVIGFVSAKSMDTTPNVSRFTNPVQITSADGVEGSPTWSPDGGRLAYHSQQDGDYDIWVAPAAGGRPLNLTNDYEGRDYAPAWSPNGDRIAFQSDRDGGGFFVISAFGGPARRVCPGSGNDARNQFNASASVPYGAPVWSSDGSEIACMDGAVQVEFDTLETRQTRQITLSASSGFALDLARSPDGGLLAFVDAFPGPDVTRLRIVSAASGEGIEVTDGLFNDRSPRWSHDGDKLYYVTNRGGAMDLWEQSLDAQGNPTASPSRLTTGIGMTEAVFSPDQTKLAYTRGRIVSNVWRVPVLSDRPAGWADAEQITFEQARIQFMNVSADGKKLLVSYDRTDNIDIWMLPLDGSEIVQLTTSPTPDWDPSWSADGTQFLFYSYRSGNRDIWRMPIAGGAAHQLTHSKAADAFATASPDGGRIAFSSARDGTSAIWLMNSDGSDQRAFAASDGLVSTWTPDGESLVVQHSNGELWEHPVDGSAPRRLTPQPGLARVSWSRDGATMFFAETTAVGRIWALSVSDGTLRKLTDLVGRPGALVAGSLTSDGDYLYFGWQDSLGDIWVMDVAQE